MPRVAAARARRLAEHLEVRVRCAGGGDGRQARRAARPARQGVRRPAAGYQGSDALVAKLQEHCRTVAAPYTYPREVKFTDELPKTISGKIRRVELRERELDRGG